MFWFMASAPMFVYRTEEPIVREGRFDLYYESMRYVYICFF